MKYLLIVLFLPICLMAESFLEIDPVGNRIKEGLSEYKKQNYQGSLEKFHKAMDHLDENDPRLSFNKGASYYKLNDPNLALKYFEKSANSTDKSIKSKSHFNRGNSFYKSGDKLSAIKSYMDALKTDPNSKNAQKNIELIRKEYNEKKKQQNQNTAANSKNPNNQNSQKNMQSPDDRTSSNSENKTPEDQSNSNQFHDKENNSPKITREDAERILDSIKQNQIRRKKNTVNQKKRSEIFW